MNYTGASFREGTKVYAAEREALLMAAQNPLDPAHMVLVLAGNDALRTVKMARSLRREEDPVEYTVLNDGHKTKSGFRH